MKIKFDNEINWFADEFIHKAKNMTKKDKDEFEKNWLCDPWPCDQVTPNETKSKIKPIVLLGGIYEKTNKKPKV